MNALPELPGLLVDSGFEPVPLPDDLAPAMELLAVCPDRSEPAGNGQTPLAPEPRTPARPSRQYASPLLALSLAVHLAAFAALAAYLPPRLVSTAPVDAVLAEIIFEMPAEQPADDAAPAASAAPGTDGAGTTAALTVAELADLLPPLPEALPPLAVTAPSHAVPAEPALVPPPPGPALAILAAPPQIEPETPPVTASPARETPAKRTAEAKPPARPRKAKPAPEKAAWQSAKIAGLVKAPVKTAAAAPKREPSAKPDAKTGKKPSGAKGVAGKDAASSRGAKPAASASAKAAYGARLLAHVQRFKRFPAAAQKAGQAGVARLSITIDRNGRLVGSRLAAKTGHAVLDAEAASVARRAAPYPAMPDGFGGATLTFSVALRYAR